MNVNTFCISLMCFFLILILNFKCIEVFYAFFIFSFSRIIDNEFNKVENLTSKAPNFINVNVQIPDFNIQHAMVDNAIKGNQQVIILKC